MLANPTVRRRRPATLNLCRVELSLLANHCCSAADQAGHSLHTAQTGSHTGHTELAGQPHGATPYLWPATHPARTDRLEYRTCTVQSASHAGHTWILWLDLQDERRGRSSGHCQYVDKILDPQSIDSEADSDAPRPACQTSKTGLDALPRTYATATRVPG